MRIKNIISQHRRDFVADIECESCGNIDRLTNGYDDAYYHNTVLPEKIKCTKCGETTISSGAKPNPLTPKYPEGMQL